MDESCGSVQLDVTIAAPTRGRDRWVNLTMRWQQDDPLSVALALSAYPDHPALPSGRWVILRDFVRYGLDAPTGDGDVRLCPRGGALNASRPDVVDLSLARAGRPCVLAVPGSLLAAFVAETERRAPSGEERSEALLDEFIERLLHS